MSKKIILVLIVLCFFILCCIHIHNMTKNVEKNFYYIYSYKYTKKDLKKIKVGVLSFDEYVKDYTKYIYNSYIDIVSLMNALKTDEVGAIILEESFVDTLTEYDNNILNNLHIIDKFEIKGKNVLAKEDKEKFIVYLCGVDTYGDISKVSRNDVNILGVVDLKKHDLLLISIPRDYYLPFKNGKDKLTHIGIYGMDVLLGALESLIKRDINYYVKVNFSTFIDLVDALGSIDVYSNREFTTIDGYTFHLGYNTLNGKEALSFVRERNAFALADKMRGVNSEEVIKSILNKITSAKHKFNYSKLLNNISKKVETNMSETKILSLIGNQLLNNEKWNIKVYNLSGTDSYEYTYTYPQQKLYVMLPNETKEMMINKIDEVMGDKDGQ